MHAQDDEGNAATPGNAPVPASLRFVSRCVTDALIFAMPMSPMLLTALVPANRNSRNLRTAGLPSSVVMPLSVSLGRLRSVSTSKGRLYFPSPDLSVSATSLQRKQHVGVSHAATCLRHTSPLRTFCRSQRACPPGTAPAASGSALPPR